MPASARSPRTGRVLRLERGGGDAAARSLSDEELVDRFEQGDACAVDALYDRLIGVVDGTLYRILGRREQDHADLVQSSFEQIVLTLTHRRYARACGLAAWAAAITSHVALKALRSRINERRVVERPQRRDSLLPEPVAADDVEREVSTRRAFEQLRAHLADMDPAKAVTVFLHDGLGHDLAEVAALTDVSVAAAQSRLVRGRQELRLRMSRPPQPATRERRNP
jgi:RNA polymerase sigma-70 factor (ECF subfamily)